MSTIEPCGATTVFWPEVERVDAECALDRDHAGPHHDELFGDWSEEQLATRSPWSEESAPEA